jgi:sec-independent protein translocase protein TatA
MGLGTTEMLLILAVVLLLFGPKKLPGLGRSMGEALRGFKQAMSGDELTEEQKQAAAKAARLHAEPETTDYTVSAEKKRETDRS